MIMDGDLPKRDAEHYLGDGVYASFDGYQVWLRTERDGMSHRIAMEPEVYQSLLKWMANYHTLCVYMHTT